MRGLDACAKAESLQVVHVSEGPQAGKNLIFRLARAFATGVHRLPNSLATLVILFACIAPAQDERLFDLYSRAQSAQQAGDLRSAARDYEEIIQLAPELAEAHANLGSIYYQIGDDIRAASNLENAVKLKPELTAPHFFLGVVAIRQQDHRKAIRHLETSARLDPSNLVVPFYLGEAYHAEGRYFAAAAAFWKSTSNSDFKADAHYFLNRVYGKLAELALERLSMEHPASFYVELARGQFHEGRKNWKESEKAYLDALERRPDADHLHARLGWVRHRAQGGDPTGTPPTVETNVPTLLGLLYAPPPDAGIDAMLRRSRDRLLGRAELATTPEDLYRQAQDFQVTAYLAARWIGKNAPGSYRARQLQAQLHEARGDVDDAVREYRAALRLNPGLRDVHFAIGTLLWSVSRFDEALPELEAELRVNPNHPEAHYEIADILQVRGQKAEAKSHLMESIRIAPDMAEAHLAIERIYFAEGCFDEAIAHLRTVARLEPGDPTPHYRMSIIYRRLGQADESQRALREFQRLQSSGP